MTSLHAPQGMQGIEKSKKKFLERSNAEMAANKRIILHSVNTLAKAGAMAEYRSR